MGTRESERSDLPGGVLDLLILRSLSRDSLHGYGIAEWIAARSGDVLSVGEGTLYPTLQRLLVKGWVSAEWGTSENNRKARYYRLTAAGRKQLEKELAQYKRVSLAIARVLEPA
jgi:PadR family transcriptional regulator, regulatory protein PadR